MLLLGVGMLGQAIDLSQRRPHHVVDGAAELAQFLDVVELAYLEDIACVLQAARHAARAHLEARRIGNDALLEADLGAIGEARHHRRVLSPTLGKALLRGRVTIRILKSLHIPQEARREAKAFDPAIKVHLHARLIALTAGEDHALLVGIGLEDGADRGIELGVHQHDVLPVLEGLENDAGAVFDRAGDID